jgi:hypothetical protein
MKELLVALAVLAAVAFIPAVATLTVVSLSDEASAQSRSYGSTACPNRTCTNGVCKCNK